MLICVSRRTDIPAFHAEWFMNRVRAGYCLVRNPIYRPVVYRVDLTRKNVDAFIFITKDPRPMMPYLKELGSMGYMYTFQVTITPYGKDIEPGVPFKADIADAFKELSARIGKDRIAWRYDPIILNDRIDVEYHRRKFGLLCRELEGYTDRCIFSFVDMYGKLSGRKDLRSVSHKEMDDLAQALAPIAAEHGIRLTYCCARRDLSAYGIEPAGCIDRRQMISLGIPFEELDTPLREGCRCVKNIDIGAYDTCDHGCVYCYANKADPEERSRRIYDPEAEMLFGTLESGDEIVELKGRSEPRLSDFFEYTQYGDVGKQIRR